jgi:hypothetical protein
MAEQPTPKPADQIVLEIAKQALDDAKEITVLVGLIREQNTGGVNKRLSEVGAGNAANAIRNALIARLVILVARAYAKPQQDDRHLQVAVNLLSAASTRQHFNEKGNKEKLASFDAQWTKCKADERLPKIKSFRDKYTAHLGEPKDIEGATYTELFEFAAETAKVMEQLALATGVSDKSVLSDPGLPSEIGRREAPENLFSRNLVVRRYLACRSCAEAGAFCAFLSVSDHPIMVGNQYVACSHIGWQGRISGGLFVLCRTLPQVP